MLAARADEVTELDASGWGECAERNWRESGLGELGVPALAWRCDASNHAQRYATHGLFRYFGKFPPYVAKRLMLQHSAPGDAVLDPMCGSGTTAVEALLNDRACDGLDVNPLATLLGQVKTTPVDASHARSMLADWLRDLCPDPGVDALPAGWPPSVDISRFFLPETTAWLKALRARLQDFGDCPEKELLRVGLLGIVRKVSRATSQQGRLFMDVDSAEPDPRARLERTILRNLDAVARLPRGRHPVRVRQGNAMTAGLPGRYPLIIFHPPYFNNYRYSRINALELAWLGEDHRSVAGGELREFFKVGKPEKEALYLDDLEAVLRRLAGCMGPDSTLAVMNGDTRLRGVRVPVIRHMIERVRSVLEVEKIIVRLPRFTEASWAASQRRARGELGNNMTDFIVIFRRARE